MHKFVKYHLKIIFSLLLVSLVFFSTKSHAQKFIEGSTGFFDNWQINANLGTNLFYGDLQQYKYAPYKEDWRIAYGVVFRKQLSPVIGLGFQLLNGKLHGTRFNYAGGDKMFDADVFEYNLNGTLNLSNLFAGYNPSRVFSIYGLAGIGFSNWRTKVKDYHTGKLIKSSGYTGNGPGKRTTEIVVPFGLGMNLDFNDNFGLNLESTLRPVNSDLLDAWESGFRYDFYNYTSIGLYYNLNNLNLGFLRSDPAKQQARYDRRMARQSERDVNYYDEQLSRERDRARQESSYDRTYRRAQDYREERKKYKRAQDDLRYYNRRTREQQVQPSRYRYDYQQQQDESLQAFWERHSRGELPEVVEYDVMGAFNRLSSNALNEENVLPGIDIIEIEEEEQPATLQQQTQTDRTESRTFTDQTSYKQQFSSQEIIFRVQILAKTSGHANVKQISSKHGIVESISEEYSNGVYRYVAGKFKTYEAADNYAASLQQKGIYDAFVVAYKNGIRIPLSSAKDQ